LPRIDLVEGAAMTFSIVCAEKTMEFIIEF
jgi:hypothetical protein